MALTVIKNDDRVSWSQDAWADKARGRLRGTVTETFENGIIDLVGADNLPEAFFDDILAFEEKASIRIWGFFLRESAKDIKKLFDVYLQGKFRDPTQNKDRLRRNYLPLNFDPYSYCSDGQAEYPSAFKAVQFNQFYHNPDDQCMALKIPPTVFSNYKLDNAFSIVPLPLSPITCFYYLDECKSIYDFNNSFNSFLKIGFPRILSTKLRFTTFRSESAETKINYTFRGKTPEESMLVVKHFVCKNDQFYKSYRPAVFLRDKHNDLYVAFACLPHANNHKLIPGGYLPLYNLFGTKRIDEAERVVICGTLEDADILQQQNDGNRKYAFAAFVCDPDCFYQIDFSPLKDKSVEFLISNHSGKPLEKERSIFVKLYHFLKDRKFKIKDFSFREREVIYPQFVNLNAYFQLCAKVRPRIVSNKVYCESEFQALIEKANDTNANGAQSAKGDKTGEKEKNTKSFHTGRPKHLNLTAEKTLLRPFIRRGCTTVLVGDPQIGKSRFAFALAAQVAGSNAEFLKDRLWSRCLTSDGEKTGFKVVYWVFDDVDQDDIFLQRKYFAKGLNSVQEKNLIIEPARSIRKRDCESLKEELKKYSSMGTPNHPVDFLIIDTLLSFARSPAKIFSAFEELVRLKDDLPNLAILVLHHNSKEGNPYGGILTTNMPRVIIEMKRDITSVLDDLEVPITINVIKHSNEHAGIDIIPFEIKLDNGHFVVTNNSDLPLEKVQKLVIHEYKHNQLESFSSTDIGRLLGVGRKPIETIWKQDGAEEEAQALLDQLKEEFREKAKAFNESSSKKKNRKRVGRRTISPTDYEEEDEEDDSISDY